MSWTQVYVTGLARAINPYDEEIEHYLCKRYSLTDSAGSSSSGDDTATNNLMWAGEGSTLIKRDDSGCCRGFAFLTFYSVDGAMLVVDRINNNNSDCNNNDDDDNNNVILRAELSNSKGGSTKKKSNNKKNKEEDLPDLRLRRQRKLPVRKHPVITSSDGKRTNLSNKTK